MKLAIEEPESKSLRAYVRQRHLVSSALVRTEVIRSLLPFGADAVVRGHEVLARIEIVRINDRILRDAGELEPARLRSLDAIHLATARALGPECKHILCYDLKMAQAAAVMGFRVVSP